MIAACISSADERAAVVHGAGAEHVQFFVDVRRLAEAVQHRSVVAVVLEPQGESDADIRGLASALDARESAIPVLLRFAPRITTIRQLLVYSRLMRDMRLSLRGFDELSPCVSNLTSSSDRSAREAIVGRVGSLVTRDVRHIVVCAAICSERGCTVSELAGLCGMSTRTVEERLALSRVMGAKRLLMRMLVLHTLWRESVLGWSAKRAAVAAGFASADALARRIQRVTGRRPNDLIANRSFSDVLEDLAAEVKDRSLG